MKIINLAENNGVAVTLSGAITPFMVYNSGEYGLIVNETESGKGLNVWLTKENMRKLALVLNDWEQTHRA